MCRSSPSDVTCDLPNGNTAGYLHESGDIRRGLSRTYPGTFGPVVGGPDLCRPLPTAVASWSRHHREGAVGDFLQPATWAEALEARAGRPDALPVAGGTDILVDLNFHRRHPAAILDLGRVSELT